MFRLLRTLRRRLLHQQKVKKYLLYAIGEILLVVVGILIALGINNWNEDQKDRKEEQKALQLLQIEFTTNLEQLESKIRLRNHIINQSMQIIGWMDQGAEVQIDTLLQKMSAIMIAPTFDPVFNTNLHEEKINLIKNDSLRAHLNNWNSQMADFSERENEWVNLTNSYTIPLLIRLGISRNINLSFYENPENLSYLFENSNRKRINLPKSKYLLTSKDLLNNTELEGVVSNAILMNEGINWESEAVKLYVKTILNLIEQEIK